MVLKARLIFIVLGVLSAFTDRSTSQSTYGSFCFKDDCYIRPESIGRSWTEAQRMCRKNNSTLPIVDSHNRQRNVVAAVLYFHNNVSVDVWIGATASDYGSGRWQWLDGSQYSGTVAGVLGNGEYSKSYAFLSRNLTTVTAYASEPAKTYSYICQYNNTATDDCANGTGLTAMVDANRCFVLYNDTLSWFNARNNCLENNGDLASFTDISLFHEIVDPEGSWVGLRHSQWNWQNALTRQSSEVVLTSWSSGQPNDATPTCISIDSWNLPNWKDTECSQISQYICQVLNETNIIPFEEEPTDELSTTESVRNGTFHGAESGHKVNVPLAVGLAVGLGGAAIIAIIVIIIVVVVRRHRRHSHSMGNPKSKDKFGKQNGKTNPEEEEDEAVEMNETEGQPRFDDASTDYATVQEASVADNASQMSPSSTDQGPVYSDLGFDHQEGS